MSHSTVIIIIWEQNANKITLFHFRTSQANGGAIFGITAKSMLSISSVYQYKAMQASSFHSCRKIQLGDLSSSIEQNPFFMIHLVIQLIGKWVLTDFHVYLQSGHNIQGDPKKMQPILSLLKSVTFHWIYSDLVCLNYDKYKMSLHSFSQFQFLVRILCPVEYMLQMSTTAL
jgi:hypothetical protein